MNSYGKKAKKTLLKIARLWAAGEAEKACFQCNEKSLTEHFSAVQFDCVTLELKVRAFVECCSCGSTFSELFRSEPIACWIRECEGCELLQEIPEYCPTCGKEQRCSTSSRS